MEACNFGFLPMTLQNFGRRDRWLEHKGQKNLQSLNNDSSKNDKNE